MLLADFYRDHFEPLRLRSRAQNTKRLYRTTLRNFAKFLERPPALADLTDETVGRFLSWFHDLPRSPYSCNKERANLLAIWRWACGRVDAAGERLIVHAPSVQPDIEPQDDPVCWLDGELDLLFAVCRAQAGTLCGIPAGLWWYGLHCVLWDSGERISAVVDLTWDMVDLRGGWLFVPARLRKGRRKGTTVKLHPETVAALQLIRLPQRSLVFPWPMSRTYLWSKYERILQTAGLPADRRSKFHRMRRSVATHYEANGGNATELMTHSSRKVTERYLDLRVLNKKHAADLLFRPNSEPPQAG